MKKRLNENNDLEHVSKEELASRLNEAEMALAAIRNGEVDAFIVSGPEGDKIYTLKDADHPYRLIVEEMNEGAITLEDGTILYSNKCFANMLQYPLEKITGSSLKNFLPLHEQVKFEIMMAQAQEGNAMRGEFHLVAGDSPSVKVQIAPNRFAFEGFTGFCLIVTDVTEITRKEEALEKWSQIFEHAQWGIAIYDGHTFEMVNPAFLRMYGYTATELSLKPLINLFTVENDKKDLARNTEVAKQEGRCIFEATHRRKDGTEFAVQVDLKAVKVASNASQYYYVMNVRDLTDLKTTEALMSEIQERKRREEILEERECQLKKLSSQLEESNKNLEQFAFVAAHDLKSPLRIIKLYSQLLQEKYKDPEGERFIKALIDNANDLDNLTTSLLDYARIQKSPREFQRVDCGAVLQKVMSNLELDIRESGAVIKYEPLGTVLGDGMLLIQLFQNLISNAIKFRSKETLQVNVTCSCDGSVCEFAVADNGLGIDLSEKEKIFEVFSRGTSNTQGVGIGLATCKKVVEIHEGKIWVESEPGKGATFRFVLPQAVSGQQTG